MFFPRQGGGIKPNDFSLSRKSLEFCFLIKQEATELLSDVNLACYCVLLWASKSGYFDYNY